MSRSGDTPRRAAAAIADLPTLVPSGAEADTMLPDGSLSAPIVTQRIARGTALGRYVVIDPIGRGGMGLVVSAYDPELDRRVAIKLLRWADHDAPTASRGAARLLREAQALAKVAHTNVVAVHDVGTVALGDGAPSVFVAMELLDGEPLSVWLERERPGWRVVLDVFVAAARGLAAAHAAGVIHRDFKPENVRITSSGRVVVLDFGLARSARDTETERSDPASPTAEGERAGALVDPRLTMSGAVMGTPAFMSPEQAAGHELDAASDQFSFCASLYLGLYGELPFGPEKGPIARAMWNGELRAPTGDARGSGRVPGWLRAVLARGLAREPSGRFAGMPELIEALQRDPSRRRRTIAGLAAVAAAIGIAWWGASRLAVRNDPCERAAAQIEASWSAARRDRVADTLADGSGDREYAERVVAAIDHHAGELREQRLAACRSDVSGEPGAREDAAVRIACLDRAHGHFEALLGVLEQPGEGRAAAAISAVTELSAPADCSDATALRRSMPIPDDPVLAAEVAQLRIDLGGIRSKFIAGDSRGAHAHAQEMLVRARAIGFPPVLAEALVDASRAALNLAEFDAALAYGEEAYPLAEANGADVVTSNALSILTILRTGPRPDPELAAWLSLQNEAIVHRLGNPPARLARVLADRARLKRNAHATDEAIALLERAEQALDDAGLEDADRVATLDNLGAAYAAGKRHEEALATYEHALAIGDRVLGPGHNLRVNVTLHLGQEHWHLGAHGRGLSLLFRGLDGARSAYAANHPNMVAVLNSVGVVLIDLDPAAGLALLEEALRDAKAQGDVPRILRHNVALGLRGLGRFDEANVLHRGLLADETAPKERPEWQLEVAENLLLAGDAKAAMPELEAARGLYASLVPPQPESVDLLVGLARAQLLLGDDAAALTNARRALELHERMGKTPRALALTRYTLARALRQNGLEPARQLELVVAAHAGWATDAFANRRQVAATLAFALGASPPL